MGESQRNIRLRRRRPPLWDAQTSFLATPYAPPDRGGAAFLQPPEAFLKAVESASPDQQLQDILNTQPSG